VTGLPADLVLQVGAAYSLAGRHTGRAGDTVVEHALLAEPAQRARAVRLGAGVTVQHPLLWNLGSEMLTTWGPERTARANPIDQWLAAGAILAAGTDLTRPFNPLTSVWGMVTRATRTAGVQGPGHGTDRATAIELSTAAAARLDREADRRGTIAPGRLADRERWRSVLTSGLRGSLGPRTSLIAACLIIQRLHAQDDGRSGEVAGGGAGARRCQDLEGRGELWVAPGSP
jgi:hypothetical protein